MHLLLLCSNHIKNFAKTYDDAIEQNALSRRLSSLSGGTEHNRRAAGRWFIDLTSTGDFIDWRRRRFRGLIVQYKEKQ